MKHLIAAAGIAMLVAPTFAQEHVEVAPPTGDAANGETLFGRQCVACHMVVDPDGERLAGRNAVVGPNLYGLAGHQMGSVEGYAYSDPMIALHDRGDHWDEEIFTAYVMDPTGWLRAALDDSRARSKMAFQVRNEQDARDIYAYITSLTVTE